MYADKPFGMLPALLLAFSLALSGCGGSDNPVGSGNTGTGLGMRLVFPQQSAQQGDAHIRALPPDVNYLEIKIFRKDNGIQIPILGNDGVFDPISPATESVTLRLDDSQRYIPEEPGTGILCRVVIIAGRKDGSGLSLPYTKELEMVIIKGDSNRTGTIVMDLGGSDCFDLDGDGFGVGNCPQEGTDCRDSLGAGEDTYPGAEQLCDGVNNDCGDADWPDPPADERDSDGDTFLGSEGDCDDGDPLSHPGAAEQCDGNDNNCDGERLPGEIDSDGDRFAGCADWADPQGDDPEVEGGDDCDDTDDTSFPGAPDATCNGIDNDCNGVRDDGYVPTPTSCGMGA